MSILGIDFGEKKLGLALAISKIAEPLVVLRYDSGKEVLDKIKRYLSENEVEKVVVGISEGQSKINAKVFAEKIEKEFRLPVLYIDETLTTHMAQKLSQEAGIKRKKRRKMEDAYAASLILQEYLDNL